MPIWDSENLNAPHTERELGMDELVKRLREHAHWGMTADAADGIEQLERELRVYMDAAEGHMVERLRATDELAAEKVLADRLHYDLVNCFPGSYEMLASTELYRKARGL